MPTLESYDVFLLEKGTKFALISQTFNIIQPQPVVTTNHLQGQVHRRQKLQNWTRFQEYTIGLGSQILKPL